MQYHDSKCIFVKNCDVVLYYGVKAKNIRETVIHAIQDKVRLPFADLAHFSLHHIDFSNVDLQDVDFSFSNLTGCNFSNAKIKNINFYGSILTYAKFSGTPLNHITKLVHKRVFYHF